MTGSNLYVQKLFNLVAALSLVICHGGNGVLWPLDKTYRQYVSYCRPLDQLGRRWVICLNADSDGVGLRITHDQRTNPRYEPLVGWTFVASRYPVGAGGMAHRYNLS